MNDEACRCDTDVMTWMRTRPTRTKASQASIGWMVAEQICRAY